MSSIQIKSLYGEDLLPYLDELAALEIKIFKHFPYLYDVSLDYEREYLETTYVQSDQSAVAVAFDGKEVIGASTCIPISEAEEGVKAPFEASDYPLDKVLYLGESILLKDYRAQGIGVAFFEHREAHARQLNMEYTAFCSIIRPDDHPLRPSQYRPLNTFWKNRGYQEMPQLRATMVWKDVDEERESEKELVFWVKKL